jgi:acyl-CoA thioester hydrolase
VGKSTFSLAANIDFIGEVVDGDPLRFTTQLVDFDHKRLHFFHSLYHAEEGYLAATKENLGMYIDIQSRRSTTFSDEQMDRFQSELELGQQCGAPQGLGRKLGIRR